MIKTIIKTAFVMILSVSFAEAADYGTLKKLKDKGEITIREIAIIRDKKNQSILGWVGRS